MGILSKISWCSYGDSIAADKVWHGIVSKDTRHYIVYNRGVGGQLSFLMDKCGMQIVAEATMIGQCLTGQWREMVLSGRI